MDSLIITFLKQLGLFFKGEEVTILLLNVVCDWRQAKIKKMYSNSALRVAPNPGVSITVSLTFEEPLSNSSN